MKLNQSGTAKTLVGQLLSFAAQRAKGELLQAASKTKKYRYTSTMTIDQIMKSIFRRELSASRVRANASQMCARCAPDVSHVRVKRESSVRHVRAKCEPRASQ